MGACGFVLKVDLNGCAKIPNVVAVYVYAAVSVAAGVINLIWHDFATGWQPIQAFGDPVPGREAYAIVTAVWLIVAGGAIFRPRSAAFGGAGLAIVYAIFAVFWLPRLYSVVHVLGFNLNPIIGVLAGACQNVILASAGLLIWGRGFKVAVWAFGISCILFGLSHYLGVGSVAGMVPKWLPLGGTFWAILTGSAFVLAGIAILTGICNVLAARLLAVMLLVFSAFVCLPWIINDPRGHEAWGGNAYNLTAVAAAWVLAGFLQRRTSSAL